MSLTSIVVALLTRMSTVPKWQRRDDPQPTTATDLADFPLSIEGRVGPNKVFAVIRENGRFKLGLRMVEPATGAKKRILMNDGV